MHVETLSFANGSQQCENKALNIFLSRVSDPQPKSKSSPGLSLATHYRDHGGDVLAQVVDVLDVLLGSFELNFRARG